MITSIMSFPAMGTWIEISLSSVVAVPVSSSFPAMGTWIEISDILIGKDRHLSFPAMGTWIEILAL